MLKLTTIILLVSTAARTAWSKDYYTAAVYEHKPVNTGYLSQKENLNYNVDVYVQQIREASIRGADIIVFPEYGLMQSLTSSRFNYKIMLPQVPDPDIVKNWNPCKDLPKNQKNDALIGISCAAKKYKIIVAFNYGSSLPCNASIDKNCPVDCVYLFNTEFVLNSDGTLLQTYHKRHLFGENLLNPATKFDYRTFQTNFGKFGIFTCYDIAFEEPQTLVQKYNVDSIIYSTHWLDIYPTFTAVDVQGSFARKNQVNMLAANCHQPMFGAVGSGIYSGQYGAVNYTMNTSNKPKLLISKVPINPRKGSYKPPSFTDNETINPLRHYMQKVGLYKFNFVDLKNSSGSVEVSQKGLKCTLEYKIKTNFKSGVYQFGALDGIFFSLPQRPLAFQICLLIQKTENLSTQSIFKKLKMTSNSNITIRNGIFPIVVVDYLRLAPSHEWIYENKTGTISSQNGVTRPIQLVSLSARNYAADPKRS